MSKPTDIDAYIALQPAEVQPVLETVRALIRKAAPEAVECISYGMPAYKLDGAVMIYFAGWKEHFALYPATEGLAEAFAKELEPYEVSKGTIRFPLSRPVPKRLIERLARYRADRARERAAARKRKPKKA